MYLTRTLAPQSPAPITLWRDEPLALSYYAGGMTDTTHFYQIIVDGQLDPGWSTSFQGMIITWRDLADGTTGVRQTVLDGPVLDQAALYGLLAKIFDLGLGLVAVTRYIPTRPTFKLAGRLSHTQVMLVQQSLAQACQEDISLAALFYDHLFELDPSLRPLFHRSGQEQERKFMAMLVSVVNGLTHLEMILPVMQGLGRRHASYGVQQEHYGLVEAALLWALAQVLGEHFTPAVEIAWSTLYRLVAEVMQEA
jgi:hemoglobin-like flavoprotein